MPHRNPSRLTAALVTTALGLAYAATDAFAESAFEIPAFIVGIQGQGECTDAGGGLLGEWDFTPGDPGSKFYHELDDAPIGLHLGVFDPIGAESQGRGVFDVTQTDTTLSFVAACRAVARNGDGPGHAKSYTAVHGEFHIKIAEPSIMHYEWCHNTNNPGTWGQLRLRKLVNGNFQDFKSFDQMAPLGEQCQLDTIELEAGYYQLWFHARSNVETTPGQIGDSIMGVSVTESHFEIVPALKPGDVNGDGVVDGFDLARVLGAWGSNSPDADINGDGIVDGADVALVLANWG